MTEFGTTCWRDIKVNVCSSQDFELETWFIKLTENEQKSLQEHRKIEIRSKQIEERIEQLFPDEHFYFYKIFEGDDQKNRERNLIEQRQLLKLIQDCMKAKKFYIKEGLLEPIHLVESERKLLVEGMQTSVAGIVQEIYKSQQIC